MTSFYFLLSIIFLSSLSTVKSICDKSRCTESEDKSKFKTNNTFLSSFPDFRQLNTLVLIGTHDTAAYGTIQPAEAQILNITEQLGAGIRVFDMRVRPVVNVFMMHHGPIYLGRQFDPLLSDIIKFFIKHPKEFIIMFMKVEYSDLLTTLTECEILANYNRTAGGIFVQNWKINETIGKYRGKILLAKADNGFANCTTKLQCKVQNNWKISVIGTDYTAIDKWNDIKALQDSEFDPKDHHQCYINYLSGYADIIQGPRAVSTGGYFWWGELDQTSGTNKKMISYFMNPRTTFVINMVDFPGQGLISKMTDSNYY